MEVFLVKNDDKSWYRSGFLKFETIPDRQWGMIQIAISQNTARMYQKINGSCALNGSPATPRCLQLQQFRRGSGG